MTVTLRDFIGKVFTGRGRKLRIEAISGEMCWAWDCLREDRIVFPVRLLIDGWRRGRLVMEGR